MYNGSGGSILLAMLMHGTENAAGGLVPLDLERAIVEGVPDWVALAPMNVSHAVLTWLVALVVLAVVGTGLRSGRESRSPLGPSAG